MAIAIVILLALIVVGSFMTNDQKRQLQEQAKEKAKLEGKGDAIKDAASSAMAWGMDTASSSIDWMGRKVNEAKGKYPKPVDMKNKKGA